jgi:hypothetical protein
MDAFGKIRKLNHKGFAVVYIALMIVVLVAFVGLAVDLGYMYVAKGQLQNAADAAALAGASQLPVIANVRVQAKLFAEKNNAAGEAVKIGLNDTNSLDGDIVVGYWNGSTISNTVPSGKVSNAVKVVARRTSETGTGISEDNKQVPLFFGNVINWGKMSAKADAIACRPPKPAGPIVLCESICSKPVPFKVYFNQNIATDPSGNLDGTYTVGWTEFSATSKATNLGPNSDVAKLIDGRKDIPFGLCGQTLWTNNGLGNTIDVLYDKFESDKNPSTGTWTILVPIFEFCPSSISSTESFTTLIKYAEITISEVKKPGSGSGESYVNIVNIACEACETTNFLGDKAVLVK